MRKPTFNEVVTVRIVLSDAWDWYLRSMDSEFQQFITGSVQCDGSGQQPFIDFPVTSTALLQIPDKACMLVSIQGYRCFDLLPEGIFDRDEVRVLIEGETTPEKDARRQRIRIVGQTFSATWAAFRDLWGGVFRFKKLRVKRPPEYLTLPAVPVNQLLAQQLAAAERWILICVLRRHGGNRNKTAAALGINRTTLYNKMRKYRLLTPEEAGRARA